MSAARYLLATDTLIAASVGDATRLAHALQRTKPGEVALSVITYGTFMAAALGSNRPAEAVLILRRIALLTPVLPLPAEAANRFGALTRTGMREVDRWIASHALAIGATLVTGNLRNFACVEGLGIENWLAG